MKCYRKQEGTYGEGCQQDMNHKGHHDDGSPRWSMKVNGARHCYDHPDTEYEYDSQWGVGIFSDWPRGHHKPYANRKEGDRMTDPFAEGEVHEQGETAPFVVRISRTASGVRTYTVGATIGTWQAAPLLGPDAKTKASDETVIARLFAIEKLVRDGIDAGHRAARYSGNGMAAQLRKSIIVETLRKAQTWQGIGTEWRTTNGLLTAMPGAKRSQLVADLSALTRDGLVEKEAGTGPHKQSRYRLASVTK